MPEYLAPGVYIEETSFRQKTIEGVSTSTAGFVGPARYGPINGPPELLTSLADFERIFGNLGPLTFPSPAGEMPNYLAHGVRAFFVNGGKRLYVSRVFVEADGVAPDAHYASTTVTGAGSPPTAGSFQLKARFPGTGGNVRVTFSLRAGQNLRSNSTLRGVRPFDVVLVGTPSPSSYRVYWADQYFNNATNRLAWRFRDDSSTAVEFSTLGPTNEVRLLTLGLEVLFPGPTPDIRGRTEVWESVGLHDLHPNAIQRLFASTITNRLKEMTTPFEFKTSLATVGIARVLIDQIGPAGMARMLVDGQIVSFTVELTGGRDGKRPLPTQYDGAELDPKRKSGLKTFEDVQDISMVAAPGYSTNGGNGYKTEARQIMGHLIDHCHKMQYRIAILDAPNDVSLSGVKEYRAQVDSTHGALYYPWVRVLDPVSNLEANLPPSGFVAGIYARNDIEKGVHKAPANEVVRLAVGFEVLLNKSQQDVLNPEGINCFRFFEGRGYRLWGARTVSSDPEWKYVNLRRYFAYLERSIERGTQWIVFENNTHKLWANVRRTVEDFLFNEWKSERLYGLKPEEAYFVRCDRSTMTQNDLDNGRLIVLVGVAPVRPAEFVIFRIGQWTADRPQQ
jgi:phage tail sheath protein FI